MAPLSFRRQESHRVYLQQFTNQNHDKIDGGKINTTSAAIRLTSAATCLDVTQLLRQKFGLPPLPSPEVKDTNVATRPGTSAGASASASRGDRRGGSALSSSSSSSSSFSALDRINARLKNVRDQTSLSSSSTSSVSVSTSSTNVHSRKSRRRNRRRHDPTVDDALVMVASCNLPVGYVRFEHEHESTKDLMGHHHHHHHHHAQQKYRHASNKVTAGGQDINHMYGTSSTNTSASTSTGTTNVGMKHSMSSSSSTSANNTEPFSVFRTLLPEENPLQVKDEMWYHLQQIQEEADQIVYGMSSTATTTAVNAATSSSSSSSNDNFSTRSSPRRGGRKVARPAPVIRLFFMPRVNSGVSSATIEIHGYCTGTESDDDDENDDDDDNAEDDRSIENENEVLGKSLLSSSSSSSSSSSTTSSSSSIAPSNEDDSMPLWKRELIPYYNMSQNYRQGSTTDMTSTSSSNNNNMKFSRHQERLHKERHRLAILSGLENSGGNECVKGYLLKQSRTDLNVWCRVHCSLLTNFQFWFVSRVKKFGSESGEGGMVGRHGIIPLSGTLLIENIDPSSSFSQIPFVFQLCTKEGVRHVFRASSRNAYTRWMNCISMSIVQGQENSYFELAEEMIQKDSATY